MKSLLLILFLLFSGLSSGVVDIFKDMHMFSAFTDYSGSEFDIDISIAGDTMLASSKGVRYTGNFQDLAYIKEPEYFFKEVQSIFANDDFTLMNLENVLTDSDLSPIKKNHDPAYWYKGPTSNAKILKSGSVEAVSLSNNHTGDYGPDGLADTKKAVEDAGIEWGYDNKTIYYEKNGFKIAFICGGLWGEWQADSFVKRVREASKKSDYQVVMFHGGTMRVYEPDDWKVKACHKIVDAGADLVVGSHPHVIQPKETYKGVDIVYSLGNFCYGGSIRPENACVIYTLKLTIGPNNIVVGKESEIVPCYVYRGTTNNYQPAIMEDGKKKDKVLDFMNRKVESPI